MGLGWGAAYQILTETIPQNYSRVQFQILFWGLFISAWFGSKILFLVTAPKEIYESVAGASSFWLGGGFVFYGGLVAGLLFLFIFHRWIRAVSVDLLWAILPALTLGHGIGRVGCFLAGCCFGDITTWFWGVQMHGHFRHPTQLLEAIFLILMSVYLLKSKRSKMELIVIYLLGYGLVRFGIEWLRGDTIRGIWWALTPSEWISLGLIFSGLGLGYKLKVTDT